MKADLIIKTDGQLITCASNGRPKRGSEMRDVGIIEQGAVAISAGKIVEVGRADEVTKTIASDEVIDAGMGVICPGFVDPHTHIVFAGDRLDEFELKIAGADYLEILANGGGILSTVTKTREARFEDLVNAAARRLDQMLSCGSTTVEIKTGYGLDLDTELKMLHVIEELDCTHCIDIVPTLLAAHAVPIEYRNEPDNYVRLICSEILPSAWSWYLASRFSKTSTPFFVDVFCEQNAFSVEHLTQIVETARGLGFSIKAHVDEFTNLGGSRIAMEAGATSIDHLDEISDTEIDVLATSGTVGIVTPTVNFNLGSSKFANARKLIDSCCAIAVATDYNPGSAPCPSQPMTMAIATRYQKLKPAEAFTAATINAAFSVGIGDRCGSLELGKAADLLILDTEDHREIVYEFGAPRISKVIKQGKVVFDRESC